MCVHHVCTGALGSWGGGVRFLKLVLQGLVKPNVGARNWIQVSTRAESAHCTISLALEKTRWWQSESLDFTADVTCHLELRQRQAWSKDGISNFSFLPPLNRNFKSTKRKIYFPTNITGEFLFFFFLKDVFLYLSHGEKLYIWVYILHQTIRIHYILHLIFIYVRLYHESILSK